MSNNTDLQSISTEQLDAVSGGINLFKPAVRFGLKKLGPVGWAYSGYTGVKAYNDARKDGKSVGKSLLRGAVGAIF
jgi:hypothetical protein